MEISEVIRKLEDLQDKTTDTSAFGVLVDTAYFLRNDLPVVIESLKQIELEQRQLHPTQEI